MTEPIIGIDLGTTHMVVAVHHRGRTVVIPNDAGQPLTPSAVRFTAGRVIAVGDAALRGIEVASDTTILSAKRLIGCRSGEAVARLSSAALPVSAAADGYVRINVAGRSVSPVEVAAALLLEARLIAEAYLERNVRQAVITVPARFDDLRRRATREAARIAGLDVARLISEPTAAAVGRCAASAARDENVIAVMHCGGGSFDATVARIADGVVQVCASHGDSGLGGDDFDRVVAAGIADGFARLHGVDVRTDRQAAMRLLLAVERAKRDLSGATETVIDLPFLATATDGSPLHLRTPLHRDAFEATVDPLMRRCHDVLSKVFQDSAIDPATIHEVVAVGGGVLMPKIQRMARAFFGDRVPLTVTDPLQAVACGAATYAAVLAGQLSGILLLDVTSHAIGFALEGGKTQIVMPRNTTIPTDRCVTVTTFKDNQTAMAVDILQGERLRADGNRCIGVVVYDSIAPAPAGTPSLELRFNIDVNGVIDVAIREMATGRSVVGRCGDGESSFGVDPVRREEFRRYVAEGFGRRRVAAVCERLERLRDEHRDALTEESLAESVRVRARLMQEAVVEGDVLDRAEQLLGELELAGQVHAAIVQWVRSGRSLPSSHGPWRWIDSPAARRNLGDMIGHLADELEAVVRVPYEHPLPAGCGRPVTVTDLEKTAAGLAVFAAVDPAHWREMADPPGGMEFTECDAVLKARTAWERMRAGVAGAAVQPQATEVELLHLRTELESRGRTWWRRLLPGYRRTLRQARLAVPALAAAGHTRRLCVLEAAAARLEFQQAFAHASPRLKSLFGRLWRDEESDWLAIAAVVDSFRWCQTLGTSPSAVRQVVTSGTLPAAAVAYRTAAVAAGRVTSFLRGLGVRPTVVPQTATSRWEEVDLEALARCLNAWRDADETPEDWQAFDDVRGSFGAHCFDSADGCTRALATLSRLRVPAPPTGLGFVTLVERLRAEAALAGESCHGPNLA